MLISILLLALIAFGGMALTYLVADEKPLLWRLSAGSVIGSAVFGVIAFLVVSVAGFSPPTLIVALAISLLPLLLLRRSDTNKRFLHDWAKAKGTMQGVNSRKMKRFAYYAGFFLLFWLFFDKTMFMWNDAIHTGGSQNLGDLPYHLGTIFSFTDGSNFPPQNPSWAGAKYTYPFIADFLSACFVRLGADVRSAMMVQNIAWAFSLFVILESFVVNLTGNKLAGRIAPVLLFLSGGLGFIWFAEDLSTSGKGLYDFVMNLPKDYTIQDKFRWGNSLVVLFMTQRSLLLGMPLTVLVLGYLWKVFASEETADAKTQSEPDAGKEQSFLDKVTASQRRRVAASLLVGLLAGTLPMIHMHSLVVLFVVTAFLFVVRPAKWLEWIAFGVGVAAVAIPELVWLMTGTATETTKFFGWHFGWDKREANFVWFWFTNTGLFFPVLAAGIWVYLNRERLQKSHSAMWGRGAAAKKQKKAEQDDPPAERRPVVTLLLFYIPFAFLFIVSNAVKLAPWEWDNIKILIYWFAGSLPLVSLALAWAWEQNKVLKIAAGVCIAVLIFSGSLDVWRTVSGQIKYGVFEPDAVKIAELVKQKTDPKALFLNAPTFNSPVVLTGRQSVMRYSGHLSSHGIDYYPRETEVKQIYQGGGVAEVLLKKYNVDYVMFSPEERNTLKGNEEFFKKFPVLAESGQYRVYKVK
jgi:hypothetical protein